MRDCRPLLLALVAIAWWHSSHCARIASAELLLDDFDSPSSVSLPQMNLDYVESTGVGDLSALRRLRFVAFHTSPTGRYESAANGESALYGRLDDLNPRFDGDRNVHLQFWYDFDAIDATQGGLNNAFLLDLSSLSTPKTTVALKVFVADDVSSRYNVTLPLLGSDSPFTIVVPFAGLDWGPQATDPNFAKLRSVHFTISVSPPVGQNELDFSMTLDRVRIGQAIPEPGGAWMAVVAMIAHLALTASRGRGAR